MINITLVQHPVGQGGMMSGLLQTSGAQFQWVYDCGSNQTSALNREIEAVAARGTVDCLFLSHLDSDHVKGVEHLLLRTSVKEVVLPYLNDIDRLIAVAHDVAIGSITGTFLTFINDIEGWFAARGVTQITFISPRNDDDNNGNSESDIPDGRVGDGKIWAEWSREDIGMPPYQSEIFDEQDNVISARQFQTGASLQVMTSDIDLNWLLSPYAHRPSNKELAAFHAAVLKKFPSFQRDPNILTSILRDWSKLKQLRECYGEISSNHNLVSMSLYAGPLRPIPWRRRRHMMRHRKYWSRWQNQTMISWLCTGDMHLDVKHRREAFIAHYRKLLDLVNVFGLPHHGSKRNFDPLVLSVLPNATQCVASAAKKNSYGHPSDEVKLAVIRSGKDFIRVGSKYHSALTWNHNYLNRHI